MKHIKRYFFYPKLQSFWRCLLVILPLLLSSLTNAESFVYITDMVPIPMRSENKIQNNPSNLIKMLDSGTKLKIISTENGWTKVKFENTIGWIISRYLTSNIPARIELEALKQSNKKSQLSLSKQNSRNAQLEKQAAELRVKNTQLTIRYGKLNAEKIHIEKIYKNALEIEHKNKKLKADKLQLRTELQLLQSNNTIGQDTSARNWFITGSIVLFFGFIMGFVFQRRTNQRRF